MAEEGNRQEEQHQREKPPAETLAADAESAATNKSPKTILSRRSLHLLRQTATSLAPIISTIGIGATFGYSAVLLPQLKPPAGVITSATNATNSTISWAKSPHFLPHPDEDISITTVEQESWIAASAVILMAPGCWLSGYLMEKIGRKKSQMIVGPIYLAAWLTVGFSPGFWALITGRILSGFCIGLQSPLGPVYVAETSEPRLRGLLLAGISLAIAVGILISHVMGTWLTWRVAAHISGTFSALCFACSIFGVESPAWLAKNGRKPEAAEAWKYLRGDEAGEEFEALLASCESGGSKSSSSFYARLKSPQFLKPLLVVNAFFLTAQFSGLNAVAFYTVQMIADVSGPANPASRPHHVTIVLDVVRVAVSVVACWLTRRYPRRVLALISGAGSALSLLALSGGLIFEFGGIWWLPGSLLVAYTCLVSIGLVPIPWLLCGEIFPPESRGLGSGLSSSFAFVCFFIVVKTSPGMMAGFGTVATFLLYGTASALGTVFLYFFLPETKDKTLEEIAEGFKTKSDKNKTEK